MGFGDEVKETVGKAKEGLGDAFDNNELRRDGQQDRIEANVNEMADDAHDAADRKAADAKGGFADAVESVKDKFDGNPRT